jgi:hypothetical protein
MNQQDEMVQLVSEVVGRHEGLFVEALKASETHAAAIMSMREDLARFCAVISEQSRIINLMQQAIVELQQQAATPDVMPPAPSSSAPN